MGLFKKRAEGKRKILYAPVAGRAFPITEVPDPAFAEGMLGKGIAIMPAEGRVYAPCDGVMDMVFPTGHGVSLVADWGAEVLIHVGLETVSLGGKPFLVHGTTGDKVKKGQLLIEADLEAIKAAGLSTVTAMVICNSDVYRDMRTDVGRDVTNADAVIEVWSRT